MSEVNHYRPIEINAVLELIDAQIMWNNRNSPPRGFERYHPSAFGKCLRKMQYERFKERQWINVPDQVFDAQKIRIFETGHTMHDRWRSYFEHTGILKGIWVCKNPCCLGTPQKPKAREYGHDQLQGCFKPDVCECGFKKFRYEELPVASKELNFYGHCDMIVDFSRLDKEKYKSFGINFNDLPKKPIVIDMKTVNDYGFTKVKKEGCSKEYRIQLTIYANILDCAYGILIYENKNDSRTAAFKIEKNTDTIYKEVVRQAKLMNEMAQYGVLPPPRYKDTNEFECENCPFLTLCQKSNIWTEDNFKEKQKEFYGTLL